MITLSSSATDCGCLLSAVQTISRLVATICSSVEVDTPLCDIAVEVVDVTAKAVTPIEVLELALCIHNC
jgi:hypothetical protein